jgi:hypothetical protein
MIYEIELRDPDEIREKHYVEPMAPEGVKCYNPAFDVTRSQADRRHRYGERDLPRSVREKPESAV